MTQVQSRRQFLLFCAVGLINTAIDLSFYFLLHQVLGLSAYFASPIVVFFVMSCSYLLNAKIVFLSSLRLRQYLEFMLLTGLGLIIIQTTMSSLFETWAKEFLTSLSLFKDVGVNTFVANSLVRIVGVTFSIFWNFLFYKYFVFKVKAARTIGEDNKNISTE